jgi:putative chitinase
MDIEKLKRICKTAAGKANCDIFAPLLGELMPKWGIDTPQRQAMFLAQVLHESAEFTHLKESFKYRSADRLMAVSLTAKKKGFAAVQAALVSGDEAVAELMYGGKNGNKQYGDGLKYCAHGLIGITFFSNYLACGKALNLNLIDHPALLEVPRHAVESACWFWSTNKLNKHADLNAITACSVAINGGENGLTERKAYWKQARLSMGIA